MRILLSWLAASTGGVSHAGALYSVGVWQAFLDPASQCTYFFNTSTGDTCWEVPEEVEQYLAQVSSGGDAVPSGGTMYGSEAAAMQGGYDGDVQAQGWLGVMEGGMSEDDEGGYYDVEEEVLPYDPTTDPNYIGALCSYMVSVRSFPWGFHHLCAL